MDEVENNSVIFVSFIELVDSTPPNLLSTEDENDWKFCVVFTSIWDEPDTNIWVPLAISSKVASSDSENASCKSKRESTDCENDVNPVTESICTWDEPEMTVSEFNLVFIPLI